MTEINEAREWLIRVTHGGKTWKIGPHVKDEAKEIAASLRDKFGDENVTVHRSEEN